MSKNETRRIPQIPVPDQTENETRHPGPDVRFILLGAGLVLLLMMILFLLLFVRLGSGAPKGPFRYRREETVNYPLQEGSAFAAHRGGIITAAGDGFAMYDEEGKLLGSVRHTYETPLLLSGGKLAALCDAGGSRLSMLDAAGRLVMDLETDGTLLDASLSSEGALCYAELLPGYKTVLTVYDQKQNQIYRWYSASRYMNSCAVSGDAKYLCAAAMDGEDGDFRTTAVFFETDLDAPLTEVPLGDQLIWELQFVDDRTVCAIGECSAVFLTTEGNTLGQYDYGGQMITDYSLDGDGFTALILNKYQAGNSSALVLLDDGGAQLAERYLGEEILSVSAAGGFCAVQTPDHLYVYDKSLQLCAAQEAAASVIFPNGAAVLVQDGECFRCVPE